MAIGASISEIVCALGAESSLVAVDATSTYPASLGRLPKVGNSRALSAEGILSLRPTRVILPADAGPPAIVEQIRAAGIEVVVIEVAHSAEAAARKIEAVGRAIRRTEDAAVLAADVRRGVEAARSTAPPRRPKVLFVYARGAGTLMVSGSGTAAHAMIGLAGGDNSVVGFEGYRPLTAEAAVAAAPEIILVTRGGAESLGGDDAVLALPGIGLTPAGRARRVIAFDDHLLLGFGPRLPVAIRQLAQGFAGSEVPASSEPRP